MAVTVKAASPQGQDPIKNRDRYPFTLWRPGPGVHDHAGPCTHRSAAGVSITLPRPASMAR